MSPELPKTKSQELPKAKALEVSKPRGRRKPVVDVGEDEFLAIVERIEVRKRDNEDRQAARDERLLNHKVEQGRRRLAHDVEQSRLVELECQRRASFEAAGAEQATADRRDAREKRKLFMLIMKDAV